MSKENIKNTTYKVQNASIDQTPMNLYSPNAVSLIHQTSITKKSPSLCQINQKQLLLTISTNLAFLLIMLSGFITNTKLTDKYQKYWKCYLIMVIV